MKKAIALFALIAALSFTCALRADDTPTTKPAKGPAARGKVESVSGMVITIKSKKSGEVTVTTDANTTFTLDGKPATLADVKEGEQLTAIPAEGVATEVKISTGAHKKKAAATEPAPSAN